ncbi:MAG: PQQ-binding-like beta-propeller repeat protein, partial [Vulcanimicrobiaceae bacterium]
ARSGFNPNTTQITPQSIGSLKKVWVDDFADFNLQSQPVLATNITDAHGTLHAGVLFVGGGNASVKAVDAFTGAIVWSAQLQQGMYHCGPPPAPAIPFGIPGTFAYDGSRGLIYVADGVHTIHALNVANGAEAWRVDVAPGANDASDLHQFLHTGLLLQGNELYAGTGSTCDITPWDGRIVQVDVASHTLVGSFYPVRDAAPGIKYSGGGVWGWGAASTDGANLFLGIGNADTNSPAAPGYNVAPSETTGFGEQVVELSSNLTFESSVLPISSAMFNPPNVVDTDMSGTPIVFRPVDCPHNYIASQGKAGFLTIEDVSNGIGQPIARIQLSLTSDASNYIGNPAFSPVTNLLYAAEATAVGSYGPGMALIAQSPGCGSWSVVMNPVFGPDSAQPPYNDGNSHPRSAPTVTAGGVAFMGAPDGVMYAVDASSGAVLPWNSGPETGTANHGDLRAAATVDGDWVFVITGRGVLAAYSIDPAFTTHSILRPGPFQRPANAPPVGPRTMPHR